MKSNTRTHFPNPRLLSYPIARGQKSKIHPFGDLVVVATPHLLISPFQLKAGEFSIGHGERVEHLLSTRWKMLQVSHLLLKLQTKHFVCIVHGNERLKTMHQNDKILFFCTDSTVSHVSLIYHEPLWWKIRETTYVLRATVWRMMVHRSLFCVVIILRKGIK